MTSPASEIVPVQQNTDLACSVFNLLGVLLLLLLCLFVCSNALEVYELFSVWCELWFENETSFTC